jgi:hypothetical protein
MQPLRQGTSLEPDGGDCAVLIGDPAQLRLGLADQLDLFPCSLIAQIAAFSSDTSSPTNNLIPQSSL